MTVTLTGTSTPLLTPGRAGASTVVGTEDHLLQFDAGRAVALRWAEAGLDAGGLSAVFLSHHHSDHLSGLADLVFASWRYGGPRPLPIVAPLGPSVEFARTLLEPWRDDLAVRLEQVEGAGLQGPPEVEVRAFGVRREPTVVWSEGTTVVEAIEVHHEPVVPAVGYRVTTPAGSVAISGDTVVCDEMERLAAGCDVLVHEAARTAMLQAAGAMTRRVAEYHADTRELGGLAARAGVRVLVLTHLSPGPRTLEEEEAFLVDVREGGYGGPVVVGRDLATVQLRERGAEPEIDRGVAPASMRQASGAGAPAS